LTLHMSFFLSNAPPTPAIYTLSLHDALPICRRRLQARLDDLADRGGGQTSYSHRPDRHRRPERQGVLDQPLLRVWLLGPRDRRRSEEHTSELQSLRHLVCRLLLEKKKKDNAV